MPKAKPLSKEQILTAMDKTLSNRPASRYLNVSYIHYKKWAKVYTDEEAGKSLFEKNKNHRNILDFNHLCYKHIIIVV